MHQNLSLEKSFFFGVETKFSNGNVIKLFIWPICVLAQYAREFVSVSNFDSYELDQQHKYIMALLNRHSRIAKNMGLKSIYK
jgi:hypothetical protein